MSLPPFPRGGREVRVRPSVPVDDDLFMKKKKRRKGKGNDHEVDEDHEEMNSASKGFFGPLLPEMLSGGLLVLGCVDDIHDYDMNVSLPNGLAGTVSITDISQPYTKALQEHANDESVLDVSTSTAPPPLRQLFSVGSYVMCRVKGDPDDDLPEFIPNLGSPQRKKLSRSPLSLDPRMVNMSMTVSSLYHGMLLCAAVVSDEDHGYVMDTGIGRTNAFLRHDRASKYQTALNQGTSLAVGQLIWCTVDMPETDFQKDRVVTIQLNADPSVVTKSHVNDEIKRASLLPGTLMSGEVIGIEAWGLNVTVFENEAVVHCNHLSKPLHTTADYKLEQTVEGRLLYINPITNVLHVGLHSRIVNFYSLKPQFGDLGLWDFVNSAAVVQATANVVTFCFKKKLKGAANRAGVPTEWASDLKEYFAIGSQHRCRITKFRRLDDFVELSLNPDLLQKEVVIFDAVNAGDIVEVAITSIQQRGLHVKLLNCCDLVFGFIPNMFISDSGSGEWRMTYKHGMELKCRVLSKKSDEKFMFLAAKQSIVAEKGPPILSSFKEARLGMLVRCWVVKVFEDALLVSFFNDVKGKVKFESIQGCSFGKLDEQFACGQMIRCTIQVLDARRGRIILALAPNKSVEGKKKKNEHSPDQKSQKVGFGETEQVTKKRPINQIDVETKKAKKTKKIKDSIKSKGSKKNK